jgi:CO/xanthine dehydrogenase Mo-binding subunit
VTRPRIRPDAAAKLTGQFAYAGQERRPGDLVAVTVRSEVARGRIVDLDRRAAEAVPGVVRVLTFADVPGSRVGLKVPDMPLFADGEVRYAGEPVALVVGRDETAARAGAAALAVRVEPLRPVTDPEEALVPGAPAIVGGFPNLVHRVHQVFGDVAAERAGEVVVEATWRTGRQDACFMAPEAGRAWVADGPGGGIVHLEVATQDVHEDRRQVCAALGLPPERVVVHLGGVGGAFGGREDITLQGHLALAAYLLRRPVRMAYSRRESLLAHPSRHLASLHYLLRAAADGTLLGLTARIVLDAGAYASTSMPVTKIVHYFAAGPYRVPRIDIETMAVRTNNPVAGALRGFGATQAAFGMESTMDLLAERLRLDPRELRRRNLLRVGDPLSTSGQPLPASCQPTEVLAACDRVPLPPGPAPGLRRGVGWAVGIKSAGLGDGRPDGASITLVLTSEGIEVHSAAAEVGQGIGSILTELVQGAFPGSPVTLAAVDSRLPVSGASKASRQSMASGGAAVRAAAALRDQLTALAGGRGAGSFGPHTLLQPGERLEVIGHNPGVETEEADPVTGRGALHQAFQLMAHRAVADVDDLGVARVVQLVAVQDVGHVLEPLALRGQLIGGSVQGIGFALMEEVPVAGGVPDVNGFDRYPIPLADDVPEVVPIALEGPDERLAGGARGAGEGPLVTSPAAVAAALRAATGRPVRRIPAAPADLRPGVSFATGPVPGVSMSGAPR